MPKTNKERLQDNNTALLRIKGKAENLPPAGGGGEPNIFVQLEEPTIKKGIWLQKEAEPEHYTYDEEIFIGGTWEPDGKYANRPEYTNGNNIVCFGTDIYMLGCYGSYGYTDSYKYNTLTNTYTKLANVPYRCYNGSVAIVDTNIYIFRSLENGNGNKAYKYDILTNTWTKISDVPNSTYYSCAAAVSTDIYLFGGSSTRNSYKYDTLTDTWYSIGNSPIIFQESSAVAIGTNIYILGTSASTANSNRIYKYDTLTDTYTQLSNIPFNCVRGEAVAIGTNIYSFYNTYNYKYDTLTDTWTQLADVPHGNVESSTAAISVGNKIYLFGTASNPYLTQVYALENKTYEQDNLVVINQGKYNNVGYEVELYNNSKDVTSPKYAFADAWYYTLEDGLETDIPTYYGNGTQWVNIKNPPVEENS